jgi:hypothetical protein
MRNIRHTCQQLLALAKEVGTKKLLINPNLWVAADGVLRTYEYAAEHIIIVEQNPFSNILLS